MFLSSGRSRHQPTPGLQGVHDGGEQYDCVCGEESSRRTTVSDDNFEPVYRKFYTFRDYDDISNQIDFLRCLGAEGTVL